MRNGSKLSVGWMGMGLFLAGALTACGGITDPSGRGPYGGESHFLSACSSTCGGGFSCISGACSVECVVGDDLCGDLGEGAQCFLSDVSSDRGMCDKRCSRDSQCDELGFSYQCSEGRCRTKSQNGETTTLSPAEPRSDAGVSEAETTAQSSDEPGSDAGASEAETTTLSSGEPGSDAGVSEGSDSGGATASPPLTPSNPPTGPTPPLPSDLAAKCGSTPGDEGTADNPIELNFEDLWTAARQTRSVGTGASCYRLPGIQHEVEEYLMLHQLSADVDLYVYEEPSFGGANLCDAPMPGLEPEECYYTPNNRAPDPITRYVLVDGSKTTDGAEFVLSIEP